jgi:hypothetical protein
LAQEKAYATKHRERRRLASAAYSATDTGRARCRAYDTQGADIRAKARAYYAKKRGHFMNYRAQHKEAIAKTKRDWVLRNTGTMAAIRFKRIAAERQALPSWADISAIKAIYENAARLTQQTGIRHEVDHVIPIQSPVVCGLHIPANMQILTKAENRAKSNHLHASTSAA